MARTKEDLGAVIVDSIRDLVDGKDADLKAFGEAVATDAILAAASGGEDALVHAKAQVEPLAEHHRIRTTEISRRALERVVATSVRLMVAAVVVLMSVTAVGCGAMEAFTGALEVW